MNGSYIKNQKPSIASITGVKPERKVH